jgi:hypothetical protein
MCQVFGSALIAVSSLGFFAFAAGSRFPVFFAITILPAGLILLGRWLGR